MAGRERPLSHQQHEKWRRDVGADQLRQILFWRWDPLGVSDHFPATIDEYDSYVHRVLRALREGQTVEAVVEVLARAEEKAMGLTKADEGRLQPLAQFLLDWSEESQLWWVDESDEGLAWRRRATRPPWRR